MQLDKDKNVLLFCVKKKHFGFDCRTIINRDKLIFTNPKSEGLMKNLRSCPKAVFDSSKEASQSTECNTKNPSSLQFTVCKKNLEKPFKTIAFLVHFG